ncbi:flagellar biosynthesis protein FlaG [Variovorax sp. WS11]|uniref:flagellar protein FlaG n=1 Tax=Variovorax sp. WS11 TaxID=1105204 RepID=UPI000D0D8F3C|nr:flagellar protein FlaG [Variovorax sp. WS11]NDZ15824.1 flagellar protein FlaG [Variovorax sp. WS11]PSL79984.1 flagellar biosynthesis protein FlaG [Variovorax sp. WS11]
MSVPLGPAADRAWAAQMLVSRAGDASAAAAAGKAADGDASSTEAVPVDVETAVREINASMQGQSVGVPFEVDGDTDRLVVKVVDRVSGELIRQIPSEEVLRIAKLLGKVPGALVSESA